MGAEEAQSLVVDVGAAAGPPSAPAALTAELASASTDPSAGVVRVSVDSATSTSIHD